MSHRVWFSERKSCGIFLSAKSAGETGGYGAFGVTGAKSRARALMVMRSPDRVQPTRVRFLSLARDRENAIWRSRLQGARIFARWRVRRARALFGRITAMTIAAATPAHDAQTTRVRRVWVRKSARDRLEWPEMTPAHARGRADFAPKSFEGALPAHFGWKTSGVWRAVDACSRRGAANVAGKDAKRRRLHALAPI